MKYLEINKSEALEDTQKWDAQRKEVDDLIVRLSIEKKKLKKVEVALVESLTGVDFSTGMIVVEYNGDWYKVIDCGVSLFYPSESKYNAYVDGLRINKKTLEAHGSFPQGNEKAYSKKIYVSLVSKIMDMNAEYTAKAMSKIK